MTLFLGRSVKDDSPIELSLNSFRRHFIALGSSGSGKTVLCKCIIEEAVRNNVPVIIVDPQGDISSIALKGDAMELESNGTPITIQEEFFKKARIAVFTPSSSKSIPININPIKVPSIGTTHEEATIALDIMSSSLVSFLGYDLGSDSGKGARAYIFTILENLWSEKKQIEDLNQLADLVIYPPEKIRNVLKNLVNKKRPEEIARKIRLLTVGASALMFQKGVQLDIDMFMDQSDGKIPVNILYMNTLNSENDKQFFIANLLKELYCWMLKNPSEGVQMILYIDEIAPYIPPYPRNPPPKEAFSLLFKQGRKYGLSLIVATQNVTDIDYKALSQVNTWCLGRMMIKQDLIRVHQLLQSVDPMHVDAVTQKLPSLRTGEFILVSPDDFNDIVDFQVRWLVTKHLTLNEDNLQKIKFTNSKKFFKKYMVNKKKPKIQKLEQELKSFLTIDKKITGLFSSSREALSIKNISEKLEINSKDVEKSLNELLKNKVVKKSKVKGRSEYLYWLASFGFHPSKNILSEFLTVPIRITQIDAAKKAKFYLEGGFLFKKEEILSSEFVHIPVWRVLTKRKSKKLLFLKQKQLEVYYLSAQVDAILSCEPKTIVFKNLITESLTKLKVIEQKNLKFTSKMPHEIKNLPKIKIGRDQINRSLKLKLGLNPVEVKILLLPAWSLKVKHKNNLKIRKVVIDAFTGKLISGIP